MLVLFGNLNINKPEPNKNPYWLKNIEHKYFER